MRIRNHLGLLAAALIALAPVGAHAKGQACTTDQGPTEPKKDKKARQKKTCQQKSKSVGQEMPNCMKDSKPNEACCCEPPTGGDGSAADDKKDKEKEKGGGGGGMPQMPQMPQQQQEKKQDDGSQKAMQKEQQRQANIAACKQAAQNALPAAQKRCEATYPYDPAHPVESQLKLQQDCKQTEAFKSQADVNTCDTKYPPGV